MALDILTATLIDEEGDLLFTVVAEAFDSPHELLEEVLNSVYNPELDEESLNEALNCWYKSDHVNRKTEIQMTDGVLHVERHMR